MYINHICRKIKTILVWQHIDSFFVFNLENISSQGKKKAEIKAYNKILRQAAVEPKSTTIFDEEDSDVFEDGLEDCSTSMSDKENVSLIQNTTIKQLENEVREFRKVVLSLRSSKFM